MTSPRPAGHPVCARAHVYRGRMLRYGKSARRAGSVLGLAVMLAHCELAVAPRPFTPVVGLSAVLRCLIVLGRTSKPGGLETAANVHTPESPWNTCGVAIAHKDGLAAESLPSGRPNLQTDITGVGDHVHMQNLCRSKQLDVGAQHELGQRWWHSGQPAPDGGHNPSTELPEQWRSSSDCTFRSIGAETADMPEAHSLFKSERGRPRGRTTPDACQHSGCGKIAG